MLGRFIKKLMLILTRSKRVEIIDNEFRCNVVKNSHRFSSIKPTILKYKSKYYKIKELG